MEWVDFNDVKRTVSLQMVIDRYGLRLRRVAPGSLRGKCPLPTHGSEKSKESFTATLTKGVGGAWACQSRSCIEARGGRRGGNVLDLVAAMEGCSIRDAAVKLQQWFSVPAGTPAPARASAGPGPTPPAPAATQEPQLVSEESRAGERGEPNKPLGFTLKDINPAHPYLGTRGITRETAEAFGVGFFPGKGSMAGRVVIPIYDGWGDLVAYAGRSIDGTEPKYKFPAGFRKSLELFNLHQVPDTDAAVIVVEGFFDCMKVHQAGFPNVVALMGCSLSETQENTLAEVFHKVVLMLDGDTAGRTATGEILSRLGLRMFVRAVGLPDGKQPDMLTPEELRELLPEC
jgi:hypothetical protein